MYSAYIKSKYNYQLHSRKMKKITFLSIFILLILQNSFGQNSEKISRVLEYKPAPGQHINRLFPTPAYSDTYANALTFATTNLVNNSSMIGLGAYGGYVVVGFDHSIVNVKGEYDFKVLGNAFTNGSEPGIVMVCQDLNKNGVPDTNEPWYELAGSEYNNAQTIHNYEITYYRPDPDGQKSNIRWTDNQGNEGVVTHISFASQATMYPLWVTENTMTFKGTKLRKNAIQNGSTWTLPAFDWGYADNHANTSTDDKIGFKIDWAVDDSGNPVHLEYIDFVKIYTGSVQEAGWLGETSTEVAGVVDLHAQQQITTYPPIGADYVTLNLENMTNPTSPLAPNSHWDDTYAENVNLTAQIFKFSHRNGWGGTYWDGFTLSNHADNTDYSADGTWFLNQWGAMAKGGVNGEGSNFLIGYWDQYGDPFTTEISETSNYIEFTDNKTYKPVGVYVNNSPWAYYSIKNGDAFSRKFADGDYFKLIATGYAADGTTVTGTSEFYLADYRSINPTQWKLNDTWEWMDLSALGNVNYIRFTMESTDTGAWGINTPTYFLMDKLTVEKVNNTATNNQQIENKAYRSGNKLINLTEGDMIQIFRINGTLLYKGQVTNSQIELPSNELFIIKISSNKYNYFIR
jgi:hypothetical protein